MNLKEKFYDRLGFKRESTVNSMKANQELRAGNIVKVAETGYFYDIKNTSTSIPLNNGLFAEVKQTTFLQIVTKCVSDLTNLTNLFNTHAGTLATPDQDGHMSAGDKKKLDDSYNYTHPTGAGSNHLPSGGTSGQVLVNNGNGQGQWGDTVANLNVSGSFKIKGYEIGVEP